MQHPADSARIPFLTPARVERPPKVDPRTHGRADGGPISPETRHRRATPRLSTRIPADKLRIEDHPLTTAWRTGRFSYEGRFFVKPDEHIAAGASRSRHFIQDIIDADRAAGKNAGRVCTRFPPEPNGYLHIGHAKSICLNFGLAAEFGGACNLRFDDTNPTKEEQEYVDSIMEDVRWLGFDWKDRCFYASDYFQQLYDWAVQLIHKGKAYVCDLSAEETRQYRGTLTQPGRESPFRNRGVQDNVDLFARMKKGEFPDGSRTLRAKIDMASANINLRDPVLYRILHATHHRTGDDWCVYAMYDYAHGQSDSIEGITHSICTLEFEDHRPLYDWFIRELGIHAPQQIEFARLELTHTVLSKRKLLELVTGGFVSGWDDPRMPTISGFRRRGYTPEAIRAFCERIGVAKFNSTIDVALLEHCIRDDLNHRAARKLVVLRPLKVVIDNYPEGQVEELDAVNNPEDASMGTRKVPFSKVLYIEQDDFREDPPPKYFRLSPGREVRLRYAYFITCKSVVKDPKTGEVAELHCTYDPATRGGDAPDGRKVKATLHWVSAAHAIDAEVRLYDHLFSKEDPNDAPPGGDYKANLNPNSLDVLTARDDSAVGDEPQAQAPGSSRLPPYQGGIEGGSSAVTTSLGPKLEPSPASAAAHKNAHGTLIPDVFQFERHGYFCVDLRDSKPGKLVFNRTVTLKDTWAKIEKKG